MHVLDSFAAVALIGILSDPRAEATPTPAKAAVEAYLYAQAMLKESQLQHVRTFGSPEAPGSLSCADDLGW